MVEGGSLLRSCTPTRGAAGSNPALSASFAPALAGAFFLWLSVAAAQPAQSPPDPHAGSGPQLAAVQGAVREGHAEIVWLNVWEARTYRVKAEVGKPFSGPRDWHGRVLALARNLVRTPSGWADVHEEDASNPAAFVELFRGPKRVYRGWLFAHFPMLFGPQMGGWKVWLGDAIFPPAPKGDAHP